MNCKDVNEKSGLFAENKLDKEQEKLIKEHLAECDKCREKYILLKDTVQDIESDTILKTPPNVAAGFSLRSNSTSSINSINWYKLAGISAACLIIFIGTYYYLKSPPIHQKISVQETTVVLNTEITSENISVIEKKLSQFDTYKETSLAFDKTKKIKNPVIVLESFPERQITIIKDMKFKGLFSDFARNKEKIYTRITAEYLKDKNVKGLINNIKSKEKDKPVTDTFIVIEYKDRKLKFYNTTLKDYLEHLKLFLNKIN